MKLSEAKEIYRRSVSAVADNAMNDDDIPRLIVQLESLRSDNLRLRQLLWAAHSQGRGYGDDGEMQDCTDTPIIDFKRDSIGQIESALAERGLKRLAKEQQCRKES